MVAQQTFVEAPSSLLRVSCHVTGVRCHRFHSRLQWALPHLVLWMDREVHNLKSQIGLRLQIISQFRRFSASKANSPTPIGLQITILVTTLRRFDSCVR